MKVAAGRWAGNKPFFFWPKKKKYSLAEHYLLKCSNCNFEKDCYTSKRTIHNGKQSYFDVNVRSVHAAEGMGFSGLSQFCASMDLTLTCYIWGI